MREKMKYAFAFLCGVIYSWAVRTAFSPDFLQLSLIAGIFSMLITMVGTVIILVMISVFLEEAWSKG